MLWKTPNAGINQFCVQLNFYPFPNWIDDIIRCLILLCVCVCNLLIYPNTTVKRRRLHCLHRSPTAYIRQHYGQMQAIWIMSAQRYQFCSCFVRSSIPMFESGKMPTTFSTTNNEQSSCQCATRTIYVFPNFVFAVPKRISIKSYDFCQHRTLFASNTIYSMRLNAMATNVHFVLHWIYSLIICIWSISERSSHTHWIYCHAFWQYRIAKSNNWSKHWQHLYRNFVNICKSAWTKMKCSIW